MSCVLVTARRDAPDLVVAPSRGGSAARVALMRHVQHALFDLRLDPCFAHVNGKTYRSTRPLAVC